MIGFALPIVWMNERRQVKMAELISLAEENVKKDLNIDEVSSENNKSLVHV
jgi:cytidylate kinase